jgi:hypothetical protein
VTGAAGASCSAARPRSEYAGTSVTPVTRNPCASDRQTDCRRRQLVYDYARFAQTCRDHASGHDRRVRPQIPGLSPGGLGPHITASGSPAGLPPVSRCPPGSSPFACLPPVSRRPAFSGSYPSAVARVPVPLRFPSGFPSASNAHVSAAAGAIPQALVPDGRDQGHQFRRDPLPGSRDRPAPQICPASDRCLAPRLAGAGWIIAFTDDPVTIDDPGGPLQAQMLDVGTSSLRNPQPVQREKGKQHMLGRRPEPGGNEQGTELVAVLEGLT